MTQITEYQPILGFPMNPKRKNEYRPSVEGTDSHSDEKEER